MQDELAEAAQFCELLVTGAVLEAADPAARAKRFPALQPGRLATALSRYREADAHSFSLGRHPRMPQVGALSQVPGCRCGRMSVSHLGVLQWAASVSAAAFD